MKSLAVADRYGWPRYVAHQAYYSLVGREYEWELLPLGVDQNVGCVAWSPLGWGRLTGKIRPGQPLPEVSRLRSKVAYDGGPQVADDHLFRVLEALTSSRARRGRRFRRSPSIGCCSDRRLRPWSSARWSEEQLRDNLGAVGWRLTAEQIARLDRASETPKIYPYWHQAGFEERNPFPVG